MMGGSLGSGNIYSRPSTTVVHFGSPHGTRYEATTAADDLDRAKSDAAAAGSEGARP
jgi:hypothetical protein